MKRILVGLIYGGRSDDLPAIIKGMTINTEIDHSLVFGINKIDNVVLEIAKNNFHLYDGLNLGHFGMANRIMDVALAGKFQYFIDINDDVLILKKDWIARIIEEFEKDEKTALVTFEDCVVNPNDLIRKENGLYSKEFASAIFAAKVSAVADVGQLFDSRFFWYSGDSDMGWTFGKAGYNIRVIEKGWISHNFRCGRDLNLIGLKELADSDSMRLGKKWDEIKFLEERKNGA